MTIIYESGVNQPPVQWVELTTADVAFPDGITFQNNGTLPFYVKATTGAAPASIDGAIEYPVGAKETNLPLKFLFPGVSGAVRLWAYSAGRTIATVSHGTSTQRNVNILPWEPPVRWYELTTADVSYPNGITFQNVGNWPIYVKATSGAAPTDTDGAIEYEGGAKETDVLIEDLFPGVTGADRLWAYSHAETRVAVSHPSATTREVTLFPALGLDVARIAHDNNWLNGGTVTASGTATGFFANGPTNGLTYEKWKPDALPATWEYDHGSAAECDYCVIGAHTMGTNGNTLQVQYYDGASWVDLVPASVVPSDEPIMVIFTPQTRQRWRISISNGTSPTIGVIKFGKALQMQRPIYGGHTPVPFARQTIMRSTKSETGEFLGRSKQRTYLTTNYDWQHLTASWVRENWPSFQKAIEEEPFFIAWRPDKFGDVALGQTDETPIPSNMGIRDLMSVSLSVRARGYD